MEILLLGLTMNPVALIVLLILALLIFGERLPEVARSLGKGLMEFKKGLKAIEDEVDRPLPSLPPPRSHLYSGSGGDYRGQDGGAGHAPAGSQPPGTERSLGAPPTSHHSSPGSPDQAPAD